MILSDLAIVIINNGVHTVLEDREARGKAEGKAEYKLEALSAVAINLTKQGMTASQIANLTGLSISDIEKL